MNTLKPRYKYYHTICRVLRWLFDNPTSRVTARQLAEIGNCSPAVVYKVMATLCEYRFALDTKAINSHGQKTNIYYLNPFLNYPVTPKK